MPWLRGASLSPEDQFASEVMALVRGILGLKAKRLDDFALLIEQPVGAPITMNLQNIYVEAQRLDGAARARRLRRAVLAMVPQPRPANWRDAAPLLMPAVRPATWANAMITTAGAGGPAAVPFGGPLVPFVKVLCAIDSEHSMTFAAGADLAAWGVTDDEALRTASANLARMPCQVRRSGPTALVLGPDGYVSSWLAAPAALARVAADVGRSVVAVAATRDQLILIDAEHPDAAVRPPGPAHRQQDRPPPGRRQIRPAEGHARRPPPESRRGRLRCQAHAHATARRVFLVLGAMGQAGDQRPAPACGRGRPRRLRHRSKSHFRAGHGPSVTLRDDFSGPFQVSRERRFAAVRAGRGWTGNSSSSPSKSYQYFLEIHC
jgi:hypothetical protein